MSEEHVLICEMLSKEIQFTKLIGHATNVSETEQIRRSIQD